MKTLAKFIFICLLLLPNFSRASEEFDPLLSGGDDELALMREQLNADNPEIVSAAPSVPPEQSSVSPLPAGGTQPLLMPAAPEQDFDFFHEDEPQDAFGEKIPDPKGETAPRPQVKPGQGLADTFLEEKPKKTDVKLPIPDVSGTWVEKLKGSNPLKAVTGEGEDGVGLENLVDTSRRRIGRSNASVFNISGIMLRMSLPQVEAAMVRRGFKKTMQKYEIPNFIKWRNEEKCRANGVVGYERLASCVVQMSKEANHQYTETVKFAKYDTQEEVEVKFTSNFTNNKVYKVIYQSLAGTIRGNSAKAQYLRNLKIYDFWKKINQKYGEPDNKDEVIWGLGDNKPYLQASTGFLVLEDPMLRELDYTRMSREDQKFINTDIYNF